MAVIGEPYVGVISDGLEETFDVDGISRVCPEGTTAVKSVLGSVVDETNTPVPSEWSFEQLPAALGTMTHARVRFTPLSAGPFHYLVRFEPSVRLAQGAIFTAGPAPQRDVLATLEVPRDATCGSAHLMPGGTLVCGPRADLFCDYPYPRAVVAVRDGRFSELTTAVTRIGAGSAVWTEGADGLSRWVETDAGLVRAQTRAGPGLAARQLLAASSDFAWVIDADGGRRRWRVSGTTFDDEPMSRGPVPSFTPGSVTRDGGAFWYADGARYCLTRTEPGAGDDTCFDAPFAECPFIEPDGVWLELGSGLAHLGVDGQVAFLPIPAGHAVRPPMFWLNDPSHELTSDVFLAVVDADGGMHAERLPGGPYDRGAVDEDRLLLYSGTTLTVLRR